MSRLMTCRRPRRPGRPVPAQTVERKFLWFPRRDGPKPSEHRPQLEEDARRRRIHIRQPHTNRFPAGGGYRILHRPALLDEE